MKLAGVVLGLGWSDGDASEPTKLPPMLLSASGRPHARVFVRAEQVRLLARVETYQAVSTVGRMRVGVATLHGRVMSILGVGEPITEPGKTVALVCDLDGGETFLLEAGQVLASGTFTSLGEGRIVFDDEAVEALDAGGLYRFVERQVWLSVLHGAYKGGVPRSDPMGAATSPSAVGA